MANKTQPEVWLRGPVSGIPPLLQPVAHALLQAEEEVTEMMKDFPDELLWEKPAGMASVGFHLQHLSGVLDRLLCYAKGRVLSEDQLEYLKAEGTPPNGGNSRSGKLSEMLVETFRNHVQYALLDLRNTDPNTLTLYRGVGRAQLPSTVMGLLFHAAEHTQRHTGQLLVTVSFVKQGAA